MEEFNPELDYVESMYVAGMENRRSYSLGVKALEILSEVKCKEAQDLILEKLDRILCVSKSTEALLSFIVVAGLGKFSTLYKIVNNQLVEKAFDTSPTKNMKGLEYLQLEPDNCFYGESVVNGTHETDVYFRSLEGVEFADKFQGVDATSVNGDVFYGCKVRADGSTHRYKSFSMLGGMSLWMNYSALEKEYDFAGAKAFLIKAYQ